MSDDYIHGFSEIEQRRLTRLQNLLNAAELGEIDLTGVQSILDVGSGLGQFTRALARAARGACVVGVEREARQLAEARRQAAEAGETELVEFRSGDAEALPLSAEERGSFDLAHARFLLEHVVDPLAIVREMLTAVRPGGRVVLMDDDHELLRLWPACEPLDRVWRIYWESYRDRGHDPLIGRRLAALLRRAGARTVRVTTVFFGAAQGAPPFDPVIDNLIAILEGATDALVRSGRLGRPELDGALAALGAWRREDEATVWYSLPLAEGRR